MPYIVSTFITVPITIISIAAVVVALEESSLANQTDKYSYIDYLSIFVTVLGIVLTIVIYSMPAIVCKSLNYSDLVTKAEIITKERITNTELEENLRDIIIKDIGTDYISLDINIDDDVVSNGCIKTISIDYKQPVLIKYLYTSHSRSFKVIIVEKEELESTIVR